MAHVVVLGAGPGGMPMAFEMREFARRGDKMTVVSNSPRFPFVPSNPWVAVDWRTRQDMELNLGSSLRRKGIDFVPVGATRVHPAENRIELDDGSSIGDDFLVIATGPKRAFDAIPGLGPGACRLRRPHAVDLPRRPRGRGREGLAAVAFVALPQIPPRNVNWFAKGKWEHLAKVGFEKYFLRKMKSGTTEPVCERMVMNAMGIMKLER